MSEYCCPGTLSRRNLLRTVVVGGAGLAGATLIGCSGSDEAAENSSSKSSTAVVRQATSAGTRVSDFSVKRGGKLTLHANHEMRSIDPHFDTFPAATWVANSVYSRLVKYSWDLKELQSDLSELPERPDDFTYVFNIKSGTKFQNIAPVNGREVTSEDVKYSIERQMGQGDSQENLGKWGHRYYFNEKLASIETPDDQTIVFKTLKPYAAFMYYISNPWTVVVPREAVEVAGDLTATAVGTGPFILDQWKKGVSWNARANPDYFAKGVDGKLLPYLDEVEMLLVQEASTAAAQFINGDFAAYATDANYVERVREGRGDATEIAAPSQFGRQMRMPPTYLDKATGKIMDYKSYSTAPESFSGWQSYWEAGALFDDIRIRQAMVQGVDKQQVIDLALSGGGIPMYGAIPPQYDMWALTEEVQGAEYDAANAAKLLQAAGNPAVVGPFMWASSSAGSVADQVGEIINQQLSLLPGVNLTLEPREKTNYYDVTYKYRYFMSHHLPLASAEPSENLQSYFGRNSTYYKIYNPDIWDKIDAQDVEVDGPIRQQMVKDVQKDITRFFPMKFVYTPYIYQFYDPKLKNYRMSLDRCDGSQVTEAWLDS